MAVFTEQELMQDSTPSVESILENALYLGSGSSILTSKTVAVTENKGVQAMVVRFGDIEALAEEYGVSYLDAMSAVAEDNEIDPKVLAVAVDEAEIIENPELMNELANVVINPQSENSFAYKFCEAMVDGFAETDEEAFLEVMVDDEVAEKLMESLNESQDTDTGEYFSAKDDPERVKRSILSRLSKKLNGTTPEKEWKKKDAAEYAAKQAHKNSVFSKVKNTVLANKGKTALGVAAAGAAALAGKKAYDSYKNGFDDKAVLKQAVGKDKNWIGKKVASLRSLYQKWLAKANAEKDAGRASAFKKVAASIMNVIDALMKKLEGSIGSK